MCYKLWTTKPKALKLCMSISYIKTFPDDLWPWPWFLTYISSDLQTFSLCYNFWTILPSAQKLWTFNHAKIFWPLNLDLDFWPKKVLLYKTLIIAINSKPFNLKLWNFACQFLASRPFQSCKKMDLLTLTLNFGLKSSDLQSFNLHPY